jgi:hypothetical protein
MEYCMVVKLLDNVIQDSVLVVGFTTEEVAKKAEGLFRKFCTDINSTVTEEELEISLEDGYWEKENFSLCIHWPEVEQTILRPKKITEVEVHDPDLKDSTINIEIWKDPNSGGMFGVDTTFLEQVRCTGIPSPFNSNVFFDMRDPDEYTEPPIFDEEKPMTDA